ncbi:MAG: flagellar protein FlgN [Burkholderiales bacterium]|nr:flagellar protein FlgN [Burkholderiales bacterium]
MNQASNSIAAIRQCLNEEIAAMTTLAALLKDEQTVLVNSDINLLSEHTLNKGQLISKISDLEKKRQSVLADLGFKADAEGMRAYLQAVDAREISAQWENLLGISSQAKEDNRTNGLLINRRLSQNQGALNVLQQNNQSASLYGPNGQSMVKKAQGKGVVVR